MLDSGPLIAWIEVNLEHDENGSFSFDRETDHFVDPRLSGYGVEYMGQPSVVYRVEFDPQESNFFGTADYFGYGDWDGTSGTVSPPDDTISDSNGSGADRLLLYDLNGEQLRFGVFNHGPNSDPGETPGWGSCRAKELPAMVNLEVEEMSFDRLRIHFSIPTLDPETTLKGVEVYYRLGEAPLTVDNLDSAIQATFNGVGEPGKRSSVDVNQLFGNHTYQVGLRYADRCNNNSEIATTEATTSPQEFAQVEGFCFIATAAYGAPWQREVQALRYFRDRVLRTVALGRALVQAYYAWSPPLARLIERSPLARATVRTILQPVADLSRMGSTWHGRRRAGQSPPE